MQSAAGLHIESEEAQNNAGSARAGGTSDVMGCYAAMH